MDGLNKDFLKNLIVYGSVAIVITFAILWIFKKENTNSIVEEKLIQNIDFIPIVNERKIITKVIRINTPLNTPTNVSDNGSIIFADNVSDQLNTGDRIKLSGELASSGNIVGYTNPTIYYVKEVDTDHVTLSTMPYIEGGPEQISITTVESDNPDLSAVFVSYDQFLKYDEVYNTMLSLISRAVDSIINMPYAKSIIIGHDLHVNDTFTMVVKNISGNGDQSVSFTTEFGYTKDDAIIHDGEAILITFVVLEEPYDPTPEGLIGVTIQNLY